MPHSSEGVKSLAVSQARVESDRPILDSADRVIADLASLRASQDPWAERIRQHFRGD
jgi:hypothetical protein